MTKSEVLAHFIQRLNFHVGHMVSTDVLLKQANKIAEGKIATFQFGPKVNGATVQVEFEEETTISWSCIQRNREEAEEALQHYRKALNFLIVIESLRRGCISETDNQL